MVVISRAAAKAHEGAPAWERHRMGAPGLRHQQEWLLVQGPITPNYSATFTAQAIGAYSS